MVYSILNEDPEPLTAVRTGVPMELESIVSKCLRKEAKHRYQSATDLIADLENAENKGLFAGSGVNVSRMSMKPSAPAKPAKMLWPIVFAFAAFVVGGTLVWAFGNQGPSSGPSVSSDVVRSTIVLPTEYPFLPAQGNGLGLEISNLDITKDGKLLVYVTEFENSSALAIRNMETGATRILQDTKDAIIPRFSPDGKWIAYVSGSELYQIPVEAGRPSFISGVSNPTGHFWNTDNHIYVGDIQGGTFDKLNLDGDRTHLVPDSRCNCGMPTAGPGGQGTVVSGRDEDRVLWFQEGNEVREIGIQGSHLTFLSESEVLYARTGALYVSRFDAAAGAAVGNEHVVLNDLRTGSIVRSGHYAISDAGTLLYVAGQPSGLTTVVVRSKNGDEEDIGLPQGVYGPVDMSADERFVIILSRDRGDQHILFDRRTKSSRILPASGRRANAIWSVDGSEIAFSQVEDGRSKVFSSGADGSNQMLLFETEGEVALEGWSSDNNFMAFNATLSGLSRLFIQDLSQNSRREIRPDSVSSFWAADWSRNGDFLTYTRVGEGGSAVMIEAFPYDGARKVISTSGGEEAEWLPDQDAFVYRDGSQWLIVRQEGNDIGSFSDPELLFTGPYANIAGMEYRMMKDGSAILQRSLNTSERESRIEIVSGLNNLIDRLLNQNE
ncbi:PD40 domain-containing protein [bacterium]|nr:PD40 domain-containing protein [bacterium]